VNEPEGVVLAAGLSTRSGPYKMTLPLGDKTVIAHSIEGMYSIVDRIWVVVGWNAAQVREALSAYDRVEIVLNERFREGMFSSVKAGIARVRAPRFFLLPGDTPLVGPAVYQRLLAVRGDIVIPTFRGRSGHPVLMRSQLIPEILAQPERATLRDFIETQSKITVEIDDEGILLDLDTPEDYAMLRARCREGNNKRQG
jgi:molybdenum cofactor cytidylyltransferase